MLICTSAHLETWTPDFSSSEQADPTWIYLATHLATFTPVGCIWMPFVAALASWARRLETGQLPRRHGESPEEWSLPGSQVVGARRFELPTSCSRSLWAMLAWRDEWGDGGVGDFTWPDTWPHCAPLDAARCRSSMSQMVEALPACPPVAARL